MCLKFIEHYLWIASSMIHAGDDVGMWDEEDGFFYDVLRLPDGRAERLKVRSMVGLLPLCAVTVFEGGLLQEIPGDGVAAAAVHRGASRAHARSSTIPTARGEQGRLLGAVLNEKKLRRVLARMLDEEEFLSPYGIRSISRYHAHTPYVFHVGDQKYQVSYLPAESDSGMFGGNSNWRGPIWMPVNGLIVRALLQYYAYYGDSFTIECPTGSGRQMTLYGVAEEIARRLGSHLPQGRQRPPRGVWRRREVPGRSPLAGSHPLLRVLPWRQRRRARRQPPDRLDRDHRQDDASVRHHAGRAGPGTRQGLGGDRRGGREWDVRAVVLQAHVDTRVAPRPEYEQPGMPDPSGMRGPRRIGAVR